jgi:UDP-glucose 4-epimerase
LYETLLTKEERLVSQDLGAYFKVPADNRDLNYNKYFTEGRKHISSVDEYNSQNTNRLSLKELELKLKEISDIQEALSE